MRDSVGDPAVWSWGANIETVLVGLFGWAGDFLGDLSSVRKGDLLGEVFGCGGLGRTGTLMGDLVGDHGGDQGGEGLNPTVLIESRFVPAMERAGMEQNDGYSAQLRTDFMKF